MDTVRVVAETMTGDPDRIWQIMMIADCNQYSANVSPRTGTIHRARLVSIVLRADPVCRGVATFKAQCMHNHSK